MSRSELDEGLQCLAQEQASYRDTEREQSSGLADARLPHLSEEREPVNASKMNESSSVSPQIRCTMVPGLTTAS